MDSKILLAVIAVTILGTMSIQHIFVHAGVPPLETIQVIGNSVTFSIGGPQTSTAACPVSHPFLIGGSYDFKPFWGEYYEITPSFDTVSNSYSVIGYAPTSSASANIIAKALCANFNFPIEMGMIGGELLNINTLPLLVGAIGTNPVITGLIGITLAGIAGQAIWFFHTKRKSS